MMMMMMIKAMLMKTLAQGNFHDDDDDDDDGGDGGDGDDGGDKYANL